MQKIVPHLWFDKEAKEAAEMYVSAFKEDSKITNVSMLRNTPSGDTDIVSFTLAGQEFMAISAGPYFKFTPAISFHVKCKTKEEVDELWNTFSEGGQVLMELGEYPWSERYGWLQDKYGLSWQITFAEESEGPKIVPVMMFVGDVCGKAEEAINFWGSIFKDSKANVLMRYGAGEEPEKEGSVKYAQVILEGQEFGAMDSAQEHKFSFTEAISFIVKCKDQEEIDYYWEKLSAVPESEQCGWLKDKFGVSWQITPIEMNDMLTKGTPEQVDRVTQTFLPMKKLEIEPLKKAYEGK